MVSWLMRAAEEPSFWRVYRGIDGLAESFCVAVSVSHRGNVWIKHREEGIATKFDGYEFAVLPGAAADNAPLMESRAGQVWSVYPSGVAEYRGGRWVRYPHADVQTENRLNVLRKVRPIPLLPSERDRVLLLLPDRLIEFNVRSNLTTVLRLVSASSLERFIEMIEAADGGLWITGRRGVERFAGPLRRLQPDSEWATYPLDPAWALENPEHPVEDGSGGLIVVCDSVPPTQRAAIRLRSGGWELMCRTDERIRAAWPGERGSAWMLTRSAVFLWEPDSRRLSRREGLLAGQLYDVVSLTNGVFWIATSEGLVRSARPLWRSVPGTEGVASQVHGIAEDGAGDLWFAHVGGLTRLSAGSSKDWTWPAGEDPSTARSGGLFALRSGQVAIASADRQLLLDPQTGTFAALELPDGRGPGRILGQDAPGVLVASELESQGSGRLRALWGFDGRTWSRILDAAPDLNIRDPSFAFRARTGSLWLGGADGLTMLEGTNMLRFESASLDPLGRPIGMVESGDGRVACAVAGRILEFDGRRWHSLKQGRGRVHGMWRSRDGTLWVADSAGVHRYVDQTWVSHDANEGLPGSSAYCLFEDRSGKLWAGTARGVRVLDPLADPDPPRTQVLTPALSQDVSTEAEQAVAIGGVDKWRYTPSERLLFSHRLDQADWSPFESTAEVRLSKLMAGPHRLEVRAMDRNWNVDPAPVAFEFTSILPWYQEPRILVTGGAGGLVALALAWLAINRHLRLRRSYAEVERIVAQRTRELQQANQALLHSQKMRALGTLAAGVAHDFNNILSIVKGSAQIIESNLDDREKIKTRLNRIKTVVEQGSGVVRSILGLAKAEMRPLASCEINLLVRETARVLEDRFGAEVTIRCDLSDGMPPVIGRADMLQQILHNLVVNAVDAMAARGEVVLRTQLLASVPVDAHQALAPVEAPRYVDLAVVDQGTGIQPDVLPRVFEPFFTTKAMSSRRGTGLGLTMVFELAKQMGCGLLVESVPTRGSVFRVLIPTDVEQAPGG